MKHTAKRILSLVLVFAMLFSLASTALAGYVQPKHKNGYFYAALGDSVAAGFGITDRDEFSNMDGFDAWANYLPENTVPESYPAVFAAELLAELRDEEIIDDYNDFDWANLGVSSFQTYDYYRTLLDRSWTGTFWSNMLGMWGDSESLRQASAEYIESLDPEQLWNRNSSTAADYLANYYKVVSGEATGKDLLYTTYNIRFGVGTEPWYPAIQGLTGDARDLAMRNWVYEYYLNSRNYKIRDQVKDALIDGIYLHQVAVGEGWWQSTGAQSNYLYHDLFVSQLAKADMITLHIGANDLLEQFMFDLISIAICGSEDNPEAEQFGSATDTSSFLSYGIVTDEDPESSTYGQTICELYNPAMYLLWVTLFSLMSGIDEAAVTAQLISMLPNYQQYITDAHLTEMLAFIESTTLENRLYDNGVAAMQYYDDIVKMIKVGGTFCLDPYGKTLDKDEDDETYVTIDAINPDAQIVFIGTFDPFGTDLVYDGETYNFGNIVCNIMQDIFCGMKGGEIEPDSILTGVAEAISIAELGDSEYAEALAALQELADAFLAMKECCGDKPVEEENKTDIFGSVAGKVDWADEDDYAATTKTFKFPVVVEDEEPEAETEEVEEEIIEEEIIEEEIIEEEPDDEEQFIEKDVVVKVATVELDGTITPGGAIIDIADSADGKQIVTVIPEGAKFAVLGKAIVDGAPVDLNVISEAIGYDEEGNMITAAAFSEQYGSRPNQYGRNAQGYNRTEWDAAKASYTWMNGFSYAFDPAVVGEIDIVMRSYTDMEQFGEYMNTDDGKLSLLNFIGALTAGAAIGGQMSFADLATEDVFDVISAYYGVTDLELPDSYDYESIQSYLGLGDLEDLLSMDLVLAVVLSQTGMGPKEALETAQLLTLILDNIHYPVMRELMGKPGLKACNYVDDYIAGVAAEWDSPFVYLLDMPNENDFNPHTSVANAIWTADRIYDTIMRYVTVEGAGGEGNGMVYGPNSKRAANLYAVIFGFDATFDAVPDHGYKLESYSIDDGEEIIPTSNHIVIEDIKANTVLHVKFVEGVDPFSVGAPEGLYGINTSGVGESDGKISGTDYTMEYDTDPEFNNPIRCSNNVGGLKAGTYYVRYINDRNGNYRPVLIEDGTGVEGAVPSQVFGIAPTASGKNDGMLNRTTTQMEYSTNEDFSDAKDCADGCTGNLPAGTYYVRYKGSNKGWKVEIPAFSGVPEYAPVGLEGVAPTTTANKDGKITGTNTAMEYSTNPNFSPARNVKECNPVYTGNLTPGTYYVRYKGGSAYATVTVPRYSVTISGNVKSFNAPEGEVTIQLLQNEEVKYGTTAIGNETTYTIEDVLPGSYTMQVMKADHVAREYEVNVNDDLTKDVEIWLLGDVDGDGAVTPIDLSLVFDYIDAEAEELDDYALKCADIDEDEIVTAIDLSCMFAHCEESELLWTPYSAE